VLGFWVADEDPKYGGVFTTVGENFHTLNIGQYRSPRRRTAPASRASVRLSFSLIMPAALSRHFREGDDENKRTSVECFYCGDDRFRPARRLPIYPSCFSDS
jgi:hypothetical protein